MRIALVHEFLHQLGGAEKVLENFLEIWPDAVVHLIFYDKDKTNGIFENAKKRMSLVDKLPFAHKHPRLFLPMMPKAIEDFKFDDFDVVLSDSSSFAKGIKTDKLHICYCHTPTRFIWTEPEYIEKQKYPAFMRWFGKRALKGIKLWDYKAAQRPNFFIANSVNVQNRIKKYYDRDSIVIYPPVDSEFFQPVGSKQDYFLTVSRLEPYKRIDVLIEAFNKSGLPLKIVGTGTQLEYLRKMAKSNIQFLGRAENEELRKLYSEAKAFVFPAEEDAGIVLLEAQACGTPVIAFRAGGALELVKDGVTGEFFEKQDPSSIIEKVSHFNTAQYQSEVIRKHAMQFSKEIFKGKIKQFVEQKYMESKVRRNVIASEAKQSP